MGIPRFFKKIVQQYPDTTMSIKDVDQINYFFVDFNAMIYNVYAMFCKEHKLVNLKEYETKLIIAVCDYVKEMVHTIDPQKQLYLALDGPVPRAKMVQQRWRRFKGISDKIYLDKLKTDYNIPIVQSWDTTKISPGTEFMINLATELHRCMKNKEFCSCEVVLSDTLVPGEGEHKFMPLVRKLVGEDDNVVIFSPDADLIVLSIVSNKNNIYILKTPDKKQDPELYNRYGQDNFLYLSIDLCKKYYIDDLSKDYDKNVDLSKMTMEFTFLTFLCGNDFVLAPQYLKMSGNPKEDGYTRVTNIYKHLFNEYGEYLVIEKSTSSSKNSSSKNSSSKYTINLKIFKKLLNEIAENETQYLQIIKRKNDRLRKNPDGCRKNKNEQTEYEKAVSDYEHLEYVCRSNPFHRKYNQLFLKVDPYKNNWDEEYYKLHFGLNRSNKGGQEQVKEICHSYLESIMFNLNYYASGTPPSWRWYYKYNMPPTMNDFNIYVNSLKSLASVKFVKGKPFKPFEQLMLILPPPSAMVILPNSLGIAVNGPVTFDLNVVYGGKHIYSDPILPLVDADKILAIVAKNTDKLTAGEKKRNVLGRIKTVK